MGSFSARTARKILAGQKRADLEGRRGKQSLTIKNCRIWTPNGIQEGSIVIKDGKIARISRGSHDRVSNSIDAEGLLALPGLVDVHVHLRGLDLSYKEDFESGTSAAAAGGFTTVLDMPNTKPPTDSPARLNQKIMNAATKILVNVGFHAAAVTDELELRELARQGAFSLKLYMPHPIAPLDVNDNQEVLGMLKSAHHSKIPVTVHAEDPEILGAASRANSWFDLARLRRSKAESHAVLRMLKLQKIANCSIHFCHLTLPSSLRQASTPKAGEVSTEVAPHHLLLSTEDLKLSSWRAWMVPPLRSKQAAASLLKMTAAGKVSVIASDHAPHSIDEKREGPGTSPPGIPGLETTLPLLLTLVNKRVLSLDRFVQLLSTNPAKLFRLRGKGKLAEGADGDVVLVDLRKKGRVEPETFFSKARYSPFEGMRTIGAVRTTVVGGRMVYDQGQIVSEPGTGQVLRRGL